MQRRYTMRWRRRLIRGAIVGGIFLLACAGVGGWVVFRSVPSHEGKLTVIGLTAPVEIRWDDHGVPTIRAGNAHDAYFALGFVHATDRLWQMEAMRRLGAGRLAEVLGERGRCDRSEPCAFWACTGGRRRVFP